MLENSNILLFLLGIMPGLIYAFIIYLNSPIRTIKIKPSTFYILFGALSVFLVMAIHFTFPNFTNHIEYVIVSNTAVPTVYSNIIMNFVQIGFKEEIIKAIFFLLATFYRHKNNVKEDHPFAIMFYVCMVSLGFALVENIEYIWRGIVAGDSGEIIGIRRTVSAILAHMGFGLTMGYFFGLTKKEIHGNNSDITVLSIWYRHKKKVRNLLLISFGIILSTLLHGIYDFNLNYVSMEDFLIPLKNNTFLLHLPSIKLILIMFMVNYVMGKRLIKIENENSN